MIKKLAVVLMLAMFFTCGTHAQTRRSGKRKSPPTQKVKKPQFSTEQREAIREALTALRTINAATEIGVTYNQYVSQLVQTRGIVEQSISELPQGDVSNELSLSLKALNDVQILWSRYIAFQNSPSFRSRRKLIEAVTRLQQTRGENVNEDTYSLLTDYFDYDESDVEVKSIIDRYKLVLPTAESGKKIITEKLVFVLWSVADIHIQAATKLVNK